MVKLDKMSKRLQIFSDSIKPRLFSQGLRTRRGVGIGIVIIGLGYFMLSHLTVSDHIFSSLTFSCVISPYPMVYYHT